MNEAKTTFREKTKQKNTHTLQYKPTTHTYTRITKGPGPVRPSLPSRLAQWTARSLSSLPGMQRSRLLLRRAAMLLEWKPGVSERNWGRNPRPSTLSAGEYRPRCGRGATPGHRVAHRQLYCGRGGPRRGGKMAVFLRLERLPVFSCASFLPLCRVFRSRQALGGPLLASALRVACARSTRRCRPPTRCAPRAN